MCKSNIAIGGNIHNQIILQLFANINTPPSISNRNMAFSSRPSKCAKCSNTHKFHKHSTFVRKKLYGANGWVRNFTMQRFRCIACTHVFTLFQSFVAPYQQSTISIFKRIARCTNLSKSSLLKYFHIEHYCVGENV